MTQPRTVQIWLRDEPLQIRVYGEPQPFPKKEAVASGDYKRTGRIIFAAKDYRVRKNPVTGKPEKYDRGYKRRWMDQVARSVAGVLWDHNLTPFPKNHPVAMGCLFFLSKVPSCKLLLPSQDPDYDNLEYAVWNALKRTPAKKGKPGKHPNGILFYEDNQVVWRLQPSGKLWATQDIFPGVLITVQDAMYLQDEIERCRKVRE